VERSGARSAGGEKWCAKSALEIVARKFGNANLCYSRAAISKCLWELHGGLWRAAAHVVFRRKVQRNLSILDHLCQTRKRFLTLYRAGNSSTCSASACAASASFSPESAEPVRDSESAETMNSRASGSAGILLFNAESEAALDIFGGGGCATGRTGRQAACGGDSVNPDVQAGGHPHIATAPRTTKFGLDWNEAKRFTLRTEIRNGSAGGESARISDRRLRRSSIRRALGDWLVCRRTAARANRSAVSGCRGRLGVRYSDQKPPTRREYARLVQK